MRSIRSIPQFDAVAFQTALKTSSLGRYFIYRRSIDTTMATAKRELDEGAPHGTLVLAEEQTRGRGRITGRSWCSDAKGNLYFSLALRPKSIAECFKLNLAAPVAIVHACELQGVPARIKWPNDVWIGDRKASGIIVDTDQPDPEECTAIVGIGINLNEDMDANPDESIRNQATSVAAHLPIGGDTSVCREDFLANLLGKLEELCAMDVTEVVKEYSSKDMLAGREIIVKTKRMEDPDGYNALVDGVNSSGFLVVTNLETGEKVTLVAEEVSVRPKVASRV